MAKIKSLEELIKIREEAKNKIDLREKGENIDQLIQIRVSMATCGIASGAREIFNQLVDELEKNNVKNAVVTQTGCMGYCYAEPTIEVVFPGEESVVYGDVDSKKVVDVVKKHVMNKELLDGIIPAIHRTI